jgi:hypothetical protein
MKNSTVENIIFIILFNLWMLLLWEADINVFDNIFEADYYWYVWPIAVISHIATIVGWILLSKRKDKNGKIFACFTAMLALGILIFTIFVFTDSMFEWDLSMYILCLIALFVPIVITFISIIMLIKFAIQKIKTNN